MGKHSVFPTAVSYNCKLFYYIGVWWSPMVSPLSVLPKIKKMVKRMSKGWHYRASIYKMINVLGPVL